MRRDKKRLYGPIILTVTLILWVFITTRAVLHHDGTTLDAVIVALDGLVAGMVLASTVFEWRRYLRSRHANRGSRQART